MVKIENLNTKTKREILFKVAKYLQEAAEVEDFEESEMTLDLLVEYYLDPLSREDFFGTEGWEKFFDI